MFFFFFSSRRRHTRCLSDWSSDVCSSDLIIRVAKPKTIVFSTFGVREGLLYDMLPPAERTKDGLLCAAQTLNELLSRSARHAQELIGWTDRLARVVKLRETDEDRRMRHT